MSSFSLSEKLLDISAKQKFLTMHKLKNSFLRNVITHNFTPVTSTASTPHSHSDSNHTQNLENNSYQQSRSPDSGNYQKNLKYEQFYNKELSTVMGCIFLKKDRNVHDRNMLKRILVSKFSDEVIKGIKGESLFTNIIYQEYCTLDEEVQVNLGNTTKPNKLFYFVLDGFAKFSNSMDQTTLVGAGQFYGHEEMLSEAYVTYIKVLHNPVKLLVVDQLSFIASLSGYFCSKAQSISAELSKLTGLDFNTSQSAYNRFHLLFSFVKVRQPASSILCKRETRVNSLMVLTKGHLSEPEQLSTTSSLFKYKAVGLKQILESAPRFQHTITCQTDCEFYRISASTFRIFADLQRLKDQLHIHNYTEQQKIQIQTKEQAYKFKIKRAKITFSNKKDKAKILDKSFEKLFTSNFFFVSERNDTHRRHSLSRRYRKVVTESKQDDTIDLADPENYSTLMP